MEKPRPGTLISKYEGLFKNFTFTFEGLSEDTEKGFVKIVKDLGAKVDPGAKIIFVDAKYYNKSKKSPNYYNILYLGHSVDLRKPLDLNMYRFIPGKRQSDDVDSLKKPLKKLKITQNLGMRKKDATVDSENRNTDDVDSLEKNPKSLETSQNLEMCRKDPIVDSKKWWEVCQSLIDKNKQCNIKYCSFEPGPHEIHPKKCHTMSLYEKRIVVRYIVSNQLYKKSTSPSFWNDLRYNGYLTHRTAETLRNNYRRTIIPDIEKTGFGLPEDIKQKFAELNIK